MGMSCVGWVAAVDYALRCIKTGDRRVLIMAGTVVSRGSRFHNPMHRAIFGDGAGGVLLEASTSGCFRSGMLWTAGQYYDVIHQPHIGSIHPAQVPEEYRGSFYMGHREVIFDVLRANIGPVVDGVLGAAGLCREHVDCCFIHEPSKPLYEEAVRGSGLAREKCIEYYDRHGNTISAELPISLDETIRAGGVARGDTILMVTFGAGFNGGALVFEY
jgi:3-oxoacyl-[acyl-carrier-protein] synthase-3